MMVKPRSSNSCEPRWSTPRTAGRASLGAAVGVLAERLGTPLMPWQQHVADVGLELQDDGTPAYREVILTVPRQNGKTTLILGWELQRAIGWAQLEGPQHIAYSAQTGKDARDKLIDDQFPVLERHRKLLGIGRFRRANGNEGVSWLNGSRLGLLASSEESGHGRTIHLGVKDELFADVDHRRDQALIPAMTTVTSAQMLTASTAGTVDSVAWNTKVTLGRSMVEQRRTSGTAYFEWSADPEADPGDPATWWSCMPALGRTVGLPAIEHAYGTMALDEFKRAYLNIPTVAAAGIIPPTVWDLVCSPDVEATSDVFAFDVNPERAAAAVVAAGKGIPPVVEVVDYRPGVGWLVERLHELYLRYGAPVALDVTGPAGTFVAELERRGIPLIPVAGADVTRAVGAFYDAVVDTRVSIRRHSALDAAVAGAEKRFVGDAWAWGRKSSKVDISALVAATVGHWVVHDVGSDRSVYEQRSMAVL